MITELLLLSFVRTIVIKDESKYQIANVEYLFLILLFTEKIRN